MPSLSPALRIVLAAGAFAALHSALASRTVKRLAARLLGPQRQQALHRPLVVAQGLATSAALAVYGQRLPVHTLYRVRGPAALLLHAGQALALVALWRGVRAGGGFARLSGADGVQAWRHGGVVPPAPVAQGPEPAQPGTALPVHGPFAWSRHPLNALGVPFFWLTPHLSTKRLAFNLAATLYLWAGSHHEAARLRAAFGERYAAYERSGVPFFLPGPRFLAAALARAWQRLVRPAVPAPRPAATLVVDGVEVVVEGHGDEALLMVHGWPDTAALWDAQVAALAPAWRCVRFTLPGFDAAHGPRPVPLAHSVALLGRIADAVSPGRPVSLLLHDWGCAYGYLYALHAPARVRRIVGVDVGDAGSAAHARSLTAVDKVLVAGYQLWLALAWHLGGGAGNAMSRVLARLAGAPGGTAHVGWAMNYPYSLLWRGRYAPLLQAMQRFEPAVPMLFVHGRRKPLMFHSPSWAAALSQRPGCRVLGLDTGHWPMAEQPAAFNAAVRGWLAGPGS